MTEPKPTAPSAPPDPPAESRARFRWPHVDFVTVMLALLVIFLVLFLTAELWMPHYAD